MPIQGKGDLRLKIGSQEAVHPMWIADIQDECILGLDFLELHGCMVDFGDSVLHISGNEIPLQKMGSCSLKAYRTVLDTTVSLPPPSECVAKLELQSGEAKWEMLEPHRLDTTSVLQGVPAGRIQVNSCKPKAVIRHMHQGKKSVCNYLGRESWRQSSIRAIIGTLLIDMDTGYEPSGTYGSERGTV